MVRNWLFAGVVIAVCSLLFVGRATAQTGYTYDSLRPYLVSADDISSTGLQFVSDDQSDLGNGVIEVDRTFGGSTAGGPAIAVVGLFASQDGSTPPTSLKNSVVSGDLLMGAANAAGAQVGSINLSGSQGIGDIDQSAEFDAVIQGVSYHAFGDTFVSGNIIGLVLYFAPAGQADASVRDSILTTQDNKLP